MSAFGPDTSDADLIVAHGRGIAGAFDVLVDRYEHRVYAVALRMTGNPHDARDVTQDVFIAAMRSIDRFRGDAKLSTWLHRVAVNASLDLARKKKRRPVQALTEADERPDDGPDPSERAESAIRSAEVRAALTGLSEDHRAVVVLHDLEDLDYSEVSEVLGVPVGTVKSRLHRARIELAKSLGHLRRTEPSGAAEPLTDEP